MVFRIFNQYIPIRKLFLFGAESAFIYTIVLTASIVMQGDLLQEGNPYIGSLLITAAVQICLYICDLYDFKIFRSNLELLIRLLQSLGSALILVALLYFIFPRLIIGRGIFLFSIGFIGLGVICWRFLYNEFLKMKYSDQRIIIVGSGSLAKSIARQILDQVDSGFRIIGFTAREPEKVGLRLVNPSIIGTHDQIAAIAERERIHRIIVANEDRRGCLSLNQLLECKTKGIIIEDGIEFYERLAGKLEIDHLHPSFMIFSDGFRVSRFIRLLKRSMDLILSLTGLVTAAPLMMVIVCLIKIESPGPILYRQERVGENGTPFNLLKFRSMRDNAETDGPVWAEKEDNRVTRIGKWLRKARLDEIPQMINVLTGSMSFVGPRPERPHFVEKLRLAIPYYDQRSSVLPGITGWAQIRYPYGASIAESAEKLRYDLYYIKNMSLAFDLFIIFDTIKTILLGKGAR